MVSAHDLRRWLDTLPDDESVYIDEGGLTLRAYATSAYVEVGGNPDPDDDADEDERCEECGATIPPTATSVVNAAHAESCSLHPANVVCSDCGRPATAPHGALCESRFDRGGTTWIPGGGK